MSRIPINATFSVDHDPEVSLKEFERVWILIQAQLTMNNDIATIDKPTWNAMDKAQRMELVRRFASVFPQCDRISTTNQR